MLYAHRKAVVLSVTVVVVAAVALGAFVYLHGFAPHRPAQTTEKSTDIFNPLAVQARALLAQGKTQEAKAIFIGIDKTKLDPAQQAFIDTALAGIAYHDDPAQGAQLYAAVASTTSYPAKSRSFAILEFAASYVGQSKVGLADPFFSSAEQKQYKTLHDRYIALCEKSYALYPFGMAAAEIAREKLVPLLSEVEQGGLTAEQQANFATQASAIAQPYLQAIANGMPDMQPPDSKDVLLPTTLLSEALLLNRLELLHVADLPQTPASAFQESIDQAHTLGITDSEQFGILYFAAYYSQHADTTTDVLKELELLTAKPTLEPAVRAFIAAPGNLQAKFPTLYALAQKDAQVKSQLTQLGASFK